MKILQILIIILSTHTILTQYCNNSYFFEHSSYSCGFYFQYTDINCTNFSFNMCQWTECVDWVTINNDTTCGQWQTYTDRSWDYCTSQCCDHSVIYPYSYDSIKQCQDYLDQQYKLGMIILCSVVGGIAIIVIIGFIIAYKNSPKTNRCCGQCCSQCTIGDTLCYCCICLLRICIRQKRHHHHDHHHHHNHHHRHHQDHHDKHSNSDYQKISVEPTH